jgi:hypothetical protein
MRCKKCGKEINENEVFCKNCRKELKDVSSKKEVSELEELIEEQTRLNDLEQTKELNDLSKLVDEELNNEELGFEETNDQNVEDVKIIVPSEEVKIEDNMVPKKNKKKLIIIIILSFAVVLLCFIIVLLSLKHKRPKEEDKKDILNYENIMNEYFKSIEETIKNYKDENNEIPTWKQVNELNEYKKYDIVCEIHNIYSDGSIYLNNCKVNDVLVNYSYGNVKEDIKQGKKINIYKYTYDDYTYYTDVSSDNTVLAGTVTCKTDNCEVKNSYNKYTLIKEDYYYYLYNYESDTLEFGPFYIRYDYDYYKSILSYNNIVYGIYYNEDGSNNIYNLNTGKTLKNIKGEVLEDQMSFSPSVMYKYNFVPLEYNNVINFVNLKTGNISYTINDTISSFIEDEKNSLVYMTVYDNDYNKFKIYNSHGKLLFNGREFNKFTLSNDSLVVATESEFRVYDSKLNLKLSSKTYDSVLSLYEDFIVVIDNNHLEIVDLNDNILATFDFEWDSNKYYFHSMISGWYTYNDKYGIYLVVENSGIPNGVLGNGLKYYYIPSTGEIGVIETNDVG